MIKFSTMTSSFYLLFHEYTLVSLLTIAIYIVEIDRGEFVKRSKRPMDHPKSKMTAFATFSSFCDLLRPFLIEVLENLAYPVAKCAICYPISAAH